MKDELAVARRYARALFELYKPTELEAARDALSAVAVAWEGSIELRAAVLNPSRPLAGRVAVLRDIAAKAASGDQTLANFMAVLLENNRVSAIAEISKAFALHVDQLKKILSLEITSARPISDGEMNSLKAEIEKQYGSLSKIEWKVDAKLLGGAVVKAGDKVLDSSINGSLERLREELVS